MSKTRQTHLSNTDQRPPTETTLYTPHQFYRRILRWFDQYGRKDLPWQDNPTPYRVWVSEIMLQQTQVTTVIPYYLRFMERFPDTQSLAAADHNEVMHHWSGLGYYARARNLAKTANIIVNEYDGDWPSGVEALNALPGIGTSTAGAIASLSMGIKAPILDGNVKRVLARFHTVNGWPGHTKTQKQLWSISEHYTPKNRCKDYNQAMMDLGATVCTRTKPACHKCPLQTLCNANRTQTQTDYPTSKPKSNKPVKSVKLLVTQYKNQIWLQERPNKGIWGGLWSLPEFEDIKALEQFSEVHLRCDSKLLQSIEEKRHTFTHYHLDYQVLLISIKRRISTDTLEQLIGPGDWFDLHTPIEVGLAAPVKTLLETMKSDLLNS